MKYKVGDRVKITTPHLGGERGKLGKITSYKNPGGRWPWFIRLEDGRGDVYAEYEIELVNKPNLKVEDYEL